MKKLLVMMIFMVGACTTTEDTISDKQAFINQVAGKSFSLGYFADNGDYDDDVEGWFTIYEVIDSNTAIYKSEDKSTTLDDYIYLKIMIKDGKVWVTIDNNCTTAEDAKKSTLTDYEFIKYE